MRQLIAERRFLVVLITLSVLGLVLRLWGLDIRGLTHPEIYIPGIPLIDGISEPPPRLDFPFALWWHFHDEPHPLGWYLAMMGWTELFGTSHFALRLPSALIGAASVVLMGLLGRRIYDDRCGLLAAGMLALHGFHIYWSQNARMYTSGVFFAILSTWLLLVLLDRKGRSPWLETGYVLACVAGIMSVEFFWAILLLQVAWLALFAEPTRFEGPGRALLRPHRGAARLVQVQSIALMLSAPSLAHSVYRARQNAAREPSVDFLPDYMGFGFLLHRNTEAFPVIELPLVAVVALGTLGLLLTLYGLSLRSRPILRKAGGGDPVPLWIGVAALAVSAALLFYSGLVAFHRNTVLQSMTVLAFLSFALPGFVAVFREGIDRLPAPLTGWLERVAPGPSLLVAYTLLAPVLIFSLSFYIELLAARAWSVFIPFQLILISAGMIALWDRQRAVAALLAAVVAVLFVGSIYFSSLRPGSPRDYQALAIAAKAESQPGDLVFVRYRHWQDTPFFYYWRDVSYVTQDWAAAAAASPDARIWLIYWPNEYSPGLEQARLDAVAGYESVLRIERRRAVAELYVRDAPQ